MHSKAKGSIGELAVAKDLRQQGYFIFTELGDLSKTDLIIESEEGNLYKVQVKYVSLKENGTVEVSKRKSGPNYSFNYTAKDFDIAAVYCPEIDQVAYVSSNDLCSRSSITLRIEAPLNNGGPSTIRYFSQYTDIERALRDSTGNIQTDNAVDDEKVQTYNITNRTHKPRVPKPRPTKIQWPEDSDLKAMITVGKSLEGLARELGVSSNAIRKRCKSRGISMAQETESR